MLKALQANDGALSGDRLAPLLSFALKVNEDAGAVKQSDLQDVLDAGWSEQTLEDIVGPIAIQKLYNRIATGLGFSALPAAAFDQIGRDTVGKGDYVRSFQSFINASAV